MAKPNKTGGNQYTPDPRQALFLTNYLDPKSATFSNALQSALQAGYSQEYAESITSQMPDWLSESLGDEKRLKKAVSNLEEVQDLSIYNENGKPDPQIIEKRTKVDMFMATTIGKAKYSTKGDEGLEKLATAITGININVRKEDN